MFSVMLALAGSAAAWAQEEVITTESDQSIVVLELQAGQKVHLICKTEIGGKIWVFVNAPEIVPGMTYVMPSEEYRQAHNKLLFPLEEDSADMYFSESASSDSIDLGLYDLTSLLPLAITTKKGPSSHNTDVIQTIVLVPAALGRAYDDDQILIDPDSLVDENRDKLLAVRTEGQKKAYITHKTSGTIWGIVLRCYDSGKLVYSGFKNFADAVNSGNNFLSFKELPGQLEAHPENVLEIAEVETEEALIGYRGCTDIEKENIRIRVCPHQGTPYYDLRIYINDNYRITLYKACNTCPRFKFDSALAHARQLVNSLQGWD